MKPRMTRMTGAEWTGDPGDARFNLEVFEQPVFTDWPREPEQFSPYGNAETDEDGRTMPLEVARIRIRLDDPAGPWLDWHWRNGEQRYMVVIDDPTTTPAKVRDVYEEGRRLVGLIRERGPGRPRSSDDIRAAFWESFKGAIMGWDLPDMDPDADSVAAKMSFYTLVPDVRSGRRRRGTEHDDEALPAGSTLRARLNDWYGLSWEAAVAKARATR